MEETTIRQNKLAKLIGARFCGTENLTPLGRHSSFSVAMMPFDFWCDERICDLAWWAVARQIQLLADPHGIIDHAWKLGFGVHPHEPWGFVTEPYIDADRAKAVVNLANDAMAEWSVRVILLPPSDSSWNPGNCHPIVAVFDIGCIGSFTKAAVRWAFDQM